MNKKRIAFVLVLVAAMSLSLFFAPMAPVRTVEQNAPPDFTPEEVEEINNYYDMVSQPNFVPEVHPTLAAWQGGSDISNKVVMRDGSPSVLIYGTPWMNVDKIDSIVEIDWKVNLKAFWIIKAVLPSVESLDFLLDVDGVSTIAADEKAFATDDLNKVLDQAPPSLPQVGTDMANINDQVNADGTNAAAYDGTDVVVGHVDTGVDFGHPALQNSYSIDSYDPTGYGLVPTNYHGNMTNVANVTEWLAEGNLLTYESGGKYYLNVTGWDPVLNNMGGPRHLMGLLPPYGDGYPYGPTVGFIGLYEWAWGVNNASEFVYNELWKDWEIPAPDALNFVGNYSFGWAFQQRYSPYAKVFAPMVVLNGTGNTQHVVVDWEGGEGWTAMWNGAIYYEDMDLNTTADRDEVVGLFDWNFTDDFTDGDGLFNLANPIMTVDYTGDGVDDFSLGAFGNVWDPGFFDDETVFEAFRSDGDAIAIYFDHGTHGTATAAHVVGSDATERYYDPANNQTIALEGVAPGAKLISVASITAGARLNGHLWVCGFDYNETTKEFYYSGNHESDLTTNSWGWITTPFSEFDYLSFTWTILSVPDYLDEDYSGVLHVCSAGNEGAGFMTIGPPGASAATLTVGASTQSQWLEYLYGPTQPYEGPASFTSKGPAFSGYVKPDVMAPGSAGYSANPWYGQYFQSYWMDGPYWGAMVYNTTLFGGTSQAAPVTAGVVALVLEAVIDQTIVIPDDYLAPSLKVTIQGTADDLGLDPATQGFGRVNADAAVDLVVNNQGLVGWNLDSFNNLATMLDKPWANWGSLNLGKAVDNENFTHPRDFGDSSLYFGMMMPGDTATISHAFFNDWGASTPLDASSWSEQAMMMQMAEMYTFTGTTFSYNDTVVYDSQMYGWFNLRDEIGTSAYDTDTGAYNYVTLGVSFDAAEVAGAEPWMFLYDWDDANNTDGMPNLWNETAQLGDELHRLTNAGDPSNTNMMSWATTDIASIDGALDGNLTLVIHDPVHDTNMTAPGHEFTCTVIFWEEVAVPSGFSFEKAISSSESYNITLNTTGWETGIHQGYVEITAGSDVYKVPWSVNIVANLTGTETEVHTIVDGWGAELEPYDSAMYGCMGEDPDDWDFRSFAIYNQHATAGYLGVRAIWDDTGNDMMVEVLDANTTVLGSNAGETATTTAVIAELSAPVGYHYIMVHPTALNGTTSLPVNFTLEVMWYEELTDEPVIFTYTTDDRDGTFTLGEGDTAWGDHVVVNATYPEFDLPNLPEYEVTSIEVGFLSGVYYEESGPLVIPDSGYDPFSGAIDTSQFAWEYVSGIKDADDVYVEVDFTNGDCDVMAWWYSIDGEIQDNSTWSYGNNLLGAQTATGAHPEIGEFTADFDGDVATLAVGVFDYDLQSGQYTVIVDTRVGVFESAVGSTVTYDTYDLGRNGTFQVKISAWTDTNEMFVINYAAITFQNYFSPVLSNIEVTGTGAVKTITWDASDLNAQDTHVFEILISDDGGENFQLLATGLTALEYEWDSTGFEINNYTALVRVTDSYGLTDSIESDEFEAGTVEPPEPTEPTDTETDTGFFGLDPLVLGLIAGIGVGVVVVLILFLVKRR